jgi:hypothetical protein
MCILMDSRTPQEPADAENIAVRLLKLVASPPVAGIRGSSPGGRTWVWRFEENSLRALLGLFRTDASQARRALSEP